MDTLVEREFFSGNAFPWAVLALDIAAAEAAT